MGEFHTYPIGYKKSTCKKKNQHSIINLVKTEYGSVAQLVRALACHARGREFEPRRSRHLKEALGLLFYSKQPAPKTLSIIYYFWRF